MANFKACLDAGKIVLFSPVNLTIGDGCIPFRKLVTSLVKNGFKDIIFDLSTCNQIDSAGIGELVASFTFCNREGGSLSLNKIDGQIKDLLEITKLLPVFNVFNNDYLSYTFIEVSPENLTELKKAASMSELDALNLLITLSNGQIKVLPSKNEGIYRLSLTGNSNSELIIAAPFVIADITRSYIRDEIEEFEAIINSPISSEHDVQKFLEKHPKFLLGHEYQKLHPQIVLERDAQGSLIPDFLVQPFGKDFCDIIDLKLT